MIAWATDQKEELHLSQLVKLQLIQCTNSFVCTYKNDAIIKEVVEFQQWFMSPSISSKICVLRLELHFSMYLFIVHGNVETLMLSAMIDSHHKAIIRILFFLFLTTSKQTQFTTSHS